MLHYYLRFTQRKCELDMKTKTLASQQRLGNPTEAESLGEETATLWTFLSQAVTEQPYSCLDMWQGNCQKSGKPISKYKYQNVFLWPR